MRRFYLIASAALVFASPFPYDSDAEITENPDNALLADASDATFAQIECTSPIGYTSDGNDLEEDRNTIFRRASGCPVPGPIKKKPSLPKPAPVLREPAPVIINPYPSEKCPHRSMPTLVTCAGPEIYVTFPKKSLFSDSVVNCQPGKFFSNETENFAIKALTPSLD